jgi:hypothetical protein
MFSLCSNIIEVQSLSGVKRLWSGGDGGTPSLPSRVVCCEKTASRAAAEAAGRGARLRLGLRAWVCCSPLDDGGRWHLGIFPHHGEAWSNCSRHGGAGLLFRRRWPTSLQWCGKARSSVKTELLLRSSRTLAMMHRYLDEGNNVAAITDPLALLQGKPRSGFSRSDDGGAFGVALPLGGIVFWATPG